MRPSSLAMAGRARGAEGSEGVVGLRVCQKPQAEPGREALNQALGPSGKSSICSLAKRAPANQKWLWHYYQNCAHFRLSQDRTIKRCLRGRLTAALGTSVWRSPQLTSFKDPAEIPADGKSDFLFSLSDGMAYSTNQEEYV